jgi:hypothetical protein
MENIPWDIYVNPEKAHGTQRMSLGIFLLLEKSPWDI